MKQKILTVSLLFVAAAAAVAQPPETIVSSAGRESISQNYSLYYTLGEPVTFTGKSDNYILAAGFIGKLENNLITSTEDFSPQTTAVSPNPFHSAIDITLDASEIFQVDLYNVNGEILWSKKIEHQERYQLAPDVTQGCYYLKIINEKNGKTIINKIVKI